MRSKSIHFKGTVESALAWSAWVVMTGLMVTYWATDDIRPAVIALAMSAIAATLHIRSFCIRVDEHMQSAFELGREAGRVHHLVDHHPSKPYRRD